MSILVFGIRHACWWLVWYSSRVFLYRAPLVSLTWFGCCIGLISSTGKLFHHRCTRLHALPTVSPPWHALHPLWLYVGMSALLMHLYTFASITSEFINHVGFEIFIKARLEARKTALKCPCGENCLFRMNYFQLYKFIRDVASVL